MRLLTGLVLALALAPSALAAPGDTAWLSRWDGTTFDANAVALSADGRWAAFSTTRPMVANDFGGLRDVYLLDRATGALTLVSRSSDGLGAGNAASDEGSDPNNYLGLEVSVDGRYVVFESKASNLVAGLTEASAPDDDVFRYDRVTGAVQLVSVNAAGGVAALGGRAPQVSGDGQVVCFVSASDDIAGPTGVFDVFVRDLLAGTTVRASATPAGASPNNFSERCDVSADGRFVAYVSPATDIVPGFTDPQNHAYRRDLVAGTTVAVDAVAGAHANGQANFPRLSGDGSVVVFESQATDLLAPGTDTNASTDVYARVMSAATFERLSLADDESQLPAGGDRPSIAADASRLAFRTGADERLRDRPAGTTATIVATDFASLSGRGDQLAFRSAARDLATPNEAVGDNDVDVFARELAPGNDATAPSLTLGSTTMTVGADPSGVALVRRAGAIIRPGSTFAVGGGQLVEVLDGAGNRRAATMPARATSLRVRVSGGRVRVTFALDAKARVRLLVRKGSRTVRSTTFRPLAKGTRTVTVRAPAAGSYVAVIRIEGRARDARRSFRVR